MTDLDKASKRMMNAIIGTQGGRFYFNNYTKICEESGLVYFSTPFSGGERTAASLNVAIASLAGKNVEFNTMSAFQANIGDTLWSPKQYGIDPFLHALEDPGFVKFAFVRDPVDRFCEIYWTRFVNTAEHSGARRRLYERLEIDTSYDLTLDELASIIALDKEIIQLVPLIRPQRNLIAYDIIEFDFIGRSEKWAQDFAAISSEIFGAPIKCFDPEVEFPEEMAQPAWHRELSVEARHSLEIAYSEDYEMIEEITEARYFDR